VTGTFECGNDFSGKRVMICEIIVYLTLRVPNKRMIRIESAPLSLLCGVGIRGENLVFMWAILNSVQRMKNE